MSAVVNNVYSVCDACDVSVPIYRMYEDAGGVNEQYLQATAELGINLDNATLTPEQKKELLLLIGEY